MRGMSLPAPTLSTDRLRLRPFAATDADALWSLHSNPRVLRFWDSPPWTDRARAERFLAVSREMADEGTGVRLAIDRLADEEFVGWITLSRWNPTYRSASLGYCFHEAAWGHGYATEAARAVKDHAFQTLGFTEIYHFIDPANPRSLRVAEKLGAKPRDKLTKLVDGRETVTDIVYVLQP